MNTKTYEELNKELIDIQQKYDALKVSNEKMCDELRESKELRETIFNSLGHPAMYIREKDKIILSANKAAIDMGAKIGGHCWRHFMGVDQLSQKDQESVAKYPDIVPADLDIKCPMCKSGECFLESPIQNNSEINAFGLVWNSFWIKVSDDVFFYYAINITVQKRAEKELQEREENLRILNKLSSEMLNIKDLKSIYKFIAKSLQKRYPDTIIVYESIDELNNETQFELISGLNSSLSNKLIKVLGFDPVGKKFKLSQDHSVYLKSGNFIEYKGGVVEFSRAQVPAFAIRTIEKLLSINKIYTIGINKEKSLFSSIHFFTLKEKVINDKIFIEGFAKQAGLVIQKKMAEEELILAKKEVEKSNHDLQERVKEINGIYSLTTLVEDNENLEDIYNEFVNIVAPKSMQFPEKVFVLLEIEGKRYCNIENFKLKKSGKYLSAPIKIFGNQEGELIVTYTDDLPFIELYNQTLINSYADRISRIEERFKSRLALEENEMLLLSIAENYPNSFISIIEKDFTIGFSSGQEFKNQNLDPKDSIGLTLEQVFGDQANTVKEYYSNTFNGEEQSFELIFNEQYQHYRTVPLYAHDGTISRILAVVENITKRKQAEIELIKSREKAEESERLKSAFLANMSHEIRTPMNGILGFTELLNNHKLTSEKRQDYVTIIQDSGHRMLNTINDIINISKIDSGQMKIDIKLMNINDQFEFIYKFFKHEIEGNGIEFKVKMGLSSNEATIKSDNEKIIGVLTNLVKNAVKFTKEGSIEFGYEKKGDLLEFFVKDTGVGISEKHKEIIFERFRQGSESLTRNYEGSGLGLPISKSYVELLGGKIWVESKEGKGSVFYFTIPYTAVSEEKKLNENDDSGKEKDSAINNLKILIAEDDTVSYFFLTEILKESSSEIIQATSGVEAIESCRNNPDIDLVLMDIKMPKMNGHEATRQIRQFNTDVVIIAQTAFGLKGDREKAIEAGCTDFISKPIRKKTLMSLLEKYLNTK